MSAAPKWNVSDLVPEEYPAVNSILGANPFINLDPRQVFATLLKLGRYWATHPDSVLSRVGQLGIDLVQIATGESQIAPEANDKRFTDAAFGKNPAYRMMMQTYLAWRSAMHDLVGTENGGDWKEADQLRFATLLITEAMAPTNTLPGNPAALKHAFDTAGASLLRGMRNFVDDLFNNGGMPAQVDKRPFEVGRSLALTPGAVVYRGAVCEVIQYQATTAQVFGRPLLLIPPQINKFYIMDLAPGRSFVEFAVEHGLQVFTISWRNPTEAERQWGLDDYVGACKDAIAAVCEITGSPDCNLAGVCAGGITTALTLGHLAALGDQRVNSVTLMVTMLDTSQPSMTGMFATPALVKEAVASSRKKGVLSGDDLARVFAWLRPNDLVWNYWVNNYLMGEAPPAFDILYWNGDSTNLPARLHEGFLDLFLRNPLAESGAVTVLGTPIDLRKVKIDAYVVGGSTDHICAWRACYRATRLFGGPVEFVLNASGHVQTLVAARGNPKSHYFTGRELPQNPDQWLGEAADNPGTWWEHWLKWITPRSGQELSAPVRLGSPAHKPIAPAPGAYVLQHH